MASGGTGRGQGRHPRGCECEKCKGKKNSRPTDTGVAARVLAQAKSEQLWLSMIELECNRLGIGKDGKLLPVKKSEQKRDEKGNVIDGPDYQGRFSIIPLTNVLRYLEDRSLGTPVDTVNHLHDKPIDLNVNLSVAEVVREVRERKEAYERSRR